jgi:monoamine oxidase
VSSADAPVVVVGAGLAGLHAAWLLQNAGIEVVVLEARDRVGGRTWSHALRDGTVVERGGEFIAPEQADIRRLCRTLGLELIPHGVGFDRRPTPDAPAPTPDERAAVMDAARTRVAQRLQAGAPDFPADEAFPAPEQRTIVQRNVIARLETSLTVPLHELSARAVLGEDHAYDPAVRVRGGNQGIALALADRLGTAVRLGTPVSGVDQDESGATVRCGDGPPMRATAVVLAVPLTLLRDLALRPALPEAAAGAAARAGFGDAAKLHLPLAHPVAPSAMASPSHRWWCWISQSASDSGGAPVLSGFAGGTDAIAALGVADGAATWAAAAHALRPDLEPAGEALVTYWGAERWTRGSYSAPGVSATTNDDAAWARRYGRIVFAGEHTAAEHAASMNGAVASGERAARSLLELLAPR